MIEPLAHARTGSGEPLAMVHPLGSDRGVWEPVLEDLGRDFDCLAVDMPGFGESPELPDDVRATPTAIAAAVAATLDRLGIERAHVTGVSLGGWVALELARAGRALSVAGLCTAGLWPRPLGPRRSLARPAARVLSPALPLLMRSTALRTRMLSGSMARPERVPPADAVRRIRAYAHAPGFDAANAEMRADTFTAFDEIDVPVTLAWGEHDRLVRPSRRVPAWVRTTVLTGCGHVPTWDDPEQVARVIREGALARSAA